jgi:putative ABC transport system permease protein
MPHNYPFMNTSTLLTFNIRYYRRHLLLSILCLTGISLGVGIVVAVQLINNSALQSFTSTVEVLSGKATHSVVSEYGRIEEKYFVPIWKHPDVQAASPIVETMATTVETGDEPIRFLGLDPFLDAQFRQFTPNQTDKKKFVDFLSSPVPAVFLSAGLMRQYRLQPGGMLTVLTAGIEKKVRILGSIQGSDTLGLGEHIAIMDIAAAQELFGKLGYLDRIDIIASDNPTKLGQFLPPTLKLKKRGERTATLKSMLYSFQLNLTGMSLLALFVGIFLIYNFSMFSVLSRREDMSLLLTLGASRKELVVAFLGESILFGVVGSIIGIGFGYLVAYISLEKVSTTIAELYFYVKADTVHLTVPIVLTGLAIGFFATFVGIALPALEVSMTPPVMGIKRRTIEDRAHNVKGFLLIAAIACLLCGSVTFWASRFSIYWGWASALFVTLAFALSTPTLVSPATYYAGIAFKKAFKSLTAFMAARTIRASLSRTSIAVAALAVALSVTIGVDNMIFSFRESVRSWLDGYLQGDLYISPASPKWGHPLPEALIDQLRTNPDIEAVERYSTYMVNLEGKPVRIRAIDGHVLKDHSKFIFLKGKDLPWEKLLDGGVFISESLAVLRGLHMGDFITLKAEDGNHRFPVVAIVRDYSSDQGIIQMDRYVYERIWNDKRVQSVALFLKSDVSSDKIRSSIVSNFPGLDRTIVSNSKMKENVLVIFDKTFAPTATLKGVCLLVALLGVATALMAILLERSRDMTVLGHLGLTRKEMGWMNVFQALIMGAAAFLIAIFCGMVLTYVIVHAINYRSFGWSIDLHLNYLIYLKIFILTMLACIGSAIYPSYELVSTSIRALPDDE